MTKAKNDDERVASNDLIQFETENKTVKLGIKNAYTPLRQKIKIFQFRSIFTFSGNFSRKMCLAVRMCCCTWATRFDNYKQKKWDDFWQAHHMQNHQKQRQPKIKKWKMHTRELCALVKWMEFGAQTQNNTQNSYTQDPSHFFLLRVCFWFFLFDSWLFALFSVNKPRIRLLNLYILNFVQRINSFRTRRAYFFELEWYIYVSGGRAVRAR